MPVWNGAAFLDKSITSVRNQTYGNWELVIADDGSTDDSRAIAADHCRQDPRIKLLCNPHGGTARARNAAIGVAEGDYLAFLDADDLYHPRYLESMVTAATRENADLVICQICREGDVKGFLEEIPAENSYAMTVDQVFAGMYGGAWPLMISPWNKLYARHLFRNVRFPDGRFFEDAATVNLAVYEAERVCVLDAALYFYSATPNSSSKTLRSAELLDREWALRSHWEHFLREGRWDLARLALPFYLVELITIHARIARSDRPEDCRIIRGQFEKIYRKYRYKIQFSDVQKDRILAFRHPVLSDIRNMIRNEGIAGTIAGFIRRKIRT